MDSTTKSWNYCALQDFDDPEPTGVLRYSTDDGSIEQYNEGDGWFPARTQSDMVFYGEPGTKDIDEETANSLIAGGTLKKLKPETVKFLQRANGSQT